MTATALHPATIRDLHWPLQPDADPTVAAMLNDPYLAHIAAVELTHNDHTRPIRHWVTGTSIAVRNPTVTHPVPDLWGLALQHDPDEHRVELADGARYRVTIDVIPTRTDPHHRHQGRGRGNRRYIADPAEQADWLTGRLADGGCTDISVGQLEQRLTHSTQANQKIRSVHAVLDVTVNDPEAAAALEVGRRRAYGYGTPRWAHA